MSKNMLGEYAEDYEEKMSEIELFPSLKGRFVFVASEGCRADKMKAINDSDSLSTYKLVPFPVVQKYCLDKERVREAIIKSLQLMEDNYNYPPQLKDREFREIASKIVLERAENKRCQCIINLLLKELKL